ncbi:hypothetical protein ABZ858_30145 [Streptomyces sp. NPDC047017]|uniref:hypothetical protein n=1 Tax=Streptomyces sp. NPDC047017 TaxID=3155024 RepID=UPI0033E09F6F
MHGIGPRQAAALPYYGIRTVGLLAAGPAAVQRLLGGRAGGLATDRARGTAPASSSPAPCPPP